MFELATPWALIIILLPILIWILCPRAKPQSSNALIVPFYDAMRSVVQQGRYSLSKHSLLIPAFIWLLLVTALAGPRWVGQPEPILREGYNIMMALDLSGSMEINDMLLNNQPVSRLTIVQRAAKQFVQDRIGDRIGLILFGTRAYLQTPLTYDRKSILMRLDDATAGLAGKTTSIGDAIGLAVKRLQDVPAKGRIIILLTDGANNSGVLAPLKAAELAQNDKIKIYTIGLGSEAPIRAMANDMFIPNASADLDEDTLKKMADMTGGRYFRATDTQTLQAIYKTINQLEVSSQEQATIRPQKDYYPWFLGCALLLALSWVMSKSNIAASLRSFVRIPRSTSYVE